MDSTQLKSINNIEAHGGDEIDPNILQHRASTPEHSSWVNASAGSGKTKVLTDRILRLLLPNKKGENATKPEKILALTFTKAGANEMSIRVQDILSKWVVIEDKELKEDLDKLLGYTPTENQISTARKLFAQVIDVSGGLKIMTIHSFCQSILGRFPLEADLTPNFKPLEEEQANQYLKQAQTSLFQKIIRNPALNNAMNNIILEQSEEQFTQIISKLISERRQLSKILYYYDHDGLYQELCAYFSIIAGQTADDIIADSCLISEPLLNDLWRSCKALHGGTNTDIKHANIMQPWLESCEQERIHQWNNYKGCFLTGKSEPRKSLIKKKIAEDNPDILRILETEQKRIIEIENKIKSAKTAALTRDLFIVGKDILDEYQFLKTQHNALDFDDLIIRTLDLLNGETRNMDGLNPAPWIRFKLDQGIDHILVDEAQDTNPEQWEIIKALTDDFFDGDAAQDDKDRSLFVVGDQKQSIFSFQRADPEKFNEMRAWFQNKITASNKVFDPINFIVSFRSTIPILQLVDATFSSENTRSGLSDIPIQHQSFRPKQAGLVEIWPLFEKAQKQEFDSWTAPTKAIESSSSAAQMAQYTAQKISKWLEEKKVLDSYDRPIKPSDIMILVRSRTAFIDQLVRALKSYNVPVNGVDRMVLSEQLVVQDLCAVAQFSLLPEDDLTLACLLKSPFIGWTDEQLLEASYNRQSKNLWQYVQKIAPENIIQWLEELIFQSGKERPYEFFSHLLQTPCPAHEKSGLQALKARLGHDCLDPLTEFLNKAIDYERDHIATLQSFVEEQRVNTAQMKREMEEASEAVRIMTVHASKGLQAPIVILPDTARSPLSNKPERILWPHKTDEPLPYFCPLSDDTPEQCKPLYNRLKEKEEEESRRLLYVAMTRAEDHLYIGGFETGRKTPDNSWYRLVENGFNQLSNVIPIAENDKNILRYYKHATDKPDRAKKDKIQNNDNQSIYDAPVWLFEKVKNETMPLKPLTPSRPDEQSEAETAFSPLQSKDNSRFLRGNLTHKLLQILPDIDEGKREEMARQYLANPAFAIDSSLQDSILKETMDVLSHPEFSIIFGKGSLAEVSVTGKLDNERIISGQIDRLVVRENEVLIIDYKTNRPPPKKQSDIAPIYRKQMKAYADAIRSIYPDKPVKCALLWTDDVNLMILDDI